MDDRTTLTDDAGAFAALVPVKAWERAKTRLGRPGASLPEGLPAAFAGDTVAAARACPLVARVYVVTDQPGFAPAGTVVVPDEGNGSLNAALMAAAGRITAAEPALGLVVLLADLPCLRPEDLTAALRRGPGGGRWFVADAAGTGTTLLAAAPGVPLDPHFGPDSARRHVGSGALAVDGDLPTLRRDVDTPADLELARAMGLGSRSAQLLGRRGC